MHLIGFLQTREFSNFRRTWILEKSLIFGHRTFNTCFVHHFNHIYSRSLFYSICLRSVQAPHPRVRFAAIRCLNEICEEFEVSLTLNDLLFLFLCRLNIKFYIMQILWISRLGYSRSKYYNKYFMRELWVSKISMSHKSVTIHRGMVCVFHHCVAFLTYSSMKLEKISLIGIIK